MNLFGMSLPVEFSYAGDRTEGFEHDFVCLSEPKAVAHAHGMDLVTVYRHPASDTVWTVTDRSYEGYPAVRREVELVAKWDTDIFDGLSYSFTVDGREGRVLGILGDEVGHYGEFAASSLPPKSSTSAIPIACVGWRSMFLRSWTARVPRSTVRISISALPVCG